MLHIKFRPRGLRVKVLRFTGFVVCLLPLSYYASTGSRWLPIGFVMLLLGWQAYLSLLGISVKGNSLRIRGMCSNADIPLASVRSFEIVSKRQPLDMFNREERLVIVKIDGERIECKWISWEDRVTPWFPGIERPMRPSQQRVLRQLNQLLDEP